MKQHNQVSLAWIAGSVWLVMAPIEGLTDPAQSSFPDRRTDISGPWRPVLLYCSLVNSNELLLEIMAVSRASASVSHRGSPPENRIWVNPNPVNH